MSWSGREALPVVREWSEFTPRCPGMVGRPYWVFGRPSRVVVSPSRVYGSGQEAPLNVRERSR